MWRLGLFVAALAFFGSGCQDDQDACRAFCRIAADCLRCGPAADVDQCRDRCEALSIDEKKALGDCATDCANVRACPVFQAHPDLNPCRVQ